MNRCLELAALGAGNVAPNPMVGAVLVHENRIIGEGYHKQFGAAHAEVDCLNNVADADRRLINNSTLYVSLEPCAHFGKTPPCTDLIISQHIPSVVIACRDAFEKVNGRGIKKLNAAGIQVIEGVMEKQALELNRRFFIFHKHQRPFVILKWAQSGNGYIAAQEGQRVFISNELSNRLVHKWRSEEAAILVGTNTALLDDPALTNRHWPGKQPLRLVMDLELKLPDQLQLFDKKNPTLVFNYLKQEVGEMLSYCQLEKGKDDLTSMMSLLYEKGIQSVLVEGGAKLLQSFIDVGLWDEARVIENNKLEIPGGIPAPILKNQELKKQEQLDTDTIYYYTRQTN